MKTMTPVIAAVALAVFAALPARAEAGAVCSGIGEEQRAEAESIPHTLKLVYAQPDGAYLGNIHTRIARGGEVLVDMQCPGPWLLADLPPGSYDVTATFEGQSKSRRVTVGTGPQQQVFTF